jgi:predicted amidohydrolase
MELEKLIVPEPCLADFPQKVRDALADRKYRAAAVCMCSGHDIDANLHEAEQLILQAVEQGARFIGLPENFSWLGNEEEKLAFAEIISQRSETFLLEQAKQHQIILLGGGFAHRGPEEKTWNRSQLVGPGGVMAQYDKIHLFDVDLPDRPFCESDGTEAGKDVVVWDCATLGNPGLSICYDLRFPELYRHLAAKGAKILWVPSAFTAYTGEAHWEVLLRARAIENTCYLAAPAQGGHHFEGRDSYGHAMIVDPWGQILATTQQSRGVAVAEINLRRVDEVRAAIPSLRHRRLDI